MKRCFPVLSVLPVVLSCAFLLWGACGCSCRSVDTSDPHSVAKAFYRACAEKDSQAAAKHVVPDKKLEFLRTFESGPWPKIPAEPEVSVQISASGGGQVADVELTNAPGFQMKMKFSQGRWWIDR